MIKPLRNAAQIFGLLLVIAAMAAPTPAAADAHSDAGRFAQDFTALRTAFFECMDGVNAKSEHAPILGKTFAIDEKSNLDRESQQGEKFLDTGFFSAAELDQISRYDEEFKACSQPFRTQKYEKSNSFLRLTEAHFDWLHKTAEQLVADPSTVSIGEFNRNRHVHYTVWQSEMRRLFKIVEAPSSPEQNRQTFGRLVQTIIGADNVSYINTYGDRYLKFKGKYALTGAGALGVKDAPRGMEITLQEVLPVTGKYTEHRIWIYPDFSGGRVTTKWSRRSGTPSVKGYVWFTDANEMALTGAERSDPVELDMRQRLVMEQDTLIQYYEVYTDAEWRMVSRDVFRRLGAEEIDRLSHRYPYALQ